MYAALADPLTFAAFLWPAVKFYDRQVEIMYSVRDDDETYVVAGNMLGKDFTAALVVMWAFLVHPVARIVTTSVKDDHLRVLWGEINRFVQTAAVPLVRSADNPGGPLRAGYRELRKYLPSGELCPISYVKGMVSEKGEGMAGHHAPYTLLVIDEASGVDDQVYDQGQTWAKRKLVFGNPNETTNFFYRAVDGGSIAAD
jgi:phage terminase large subunit